MQLKRWRKEKEFYGLRLLGYRGLFVYQGEELNYIQMIITSWVVPVVELFDLLEDFFASAIGFEKSSETITSPRLKN